MPRPKKPARPETLQFTVAAGGKRAIEKRIAPSTVARYVRELVARELEMPELLNVRPVGGPRKDGA